jgi:N6-adenosine-specific RNA methylase IME4
VSEELAVAQTAFGRVHATSTALEIPGDLSYEEWEGVGLTLDRVAAAHMWWIGDWWAFGEHSYGERAAQVTDASKFKTYANAGWVSRRVESSLRREVLSWSHHKEVAALEPEQQEKLLIAAEEQAWTVRDLHRVRLALNQADTPPLPDGVYTTIVADPPWHYEEGWPEYADKAGEQNPRRDLPYQSMSLDAICQLAIPAADDAHLFLWTTNRYLEDSYDVVRAWGFEPSEVLVWCKPPRGIGPGGVFSNTAEFVVYARKGRPDHNERVDSTWWTWPRGRHSAKPVEFLDIVERVCPGPFLEMFARDKRHGWESWGLEA